MNKLFTAFLLLLLNGIPTVLQANNSGIPYAIYNYGARKDSHWLQPELPRKPQSLPYAGSKKQPILPPKQKPTNDQSIDIVHYKATDSIVFDAKHNLLSLHDQSVLNYGNMHLQAYTIALNLTTHMLTAEGKKDSDNPPIGRPIFSYKDSEKDKYGKEGPAQTRTFFMDKITYNIYTKRALVYQLLTRQTDAILTSGEVKKENETTFYTQDLTYTTCALADPHFYIRAKRTKMVQDQQITSGCFQFYFDDVPTPLGWFFGVLFLEGKRTQGLIPGEMIVEDSEHGFGLKEVGYYIFFNDYADFKITGSIYEKGFKQFEPELRYKKRYGYNGRIHYMQQHNRTQAQQIAHHFQWQHTTLATAYKKHIIHFNIDYCSKDYIKTSSKEEKKAAQQDSTTSITYQSKIGDYSLLIPLKYEEKQYNIIPTLALPNAKIPKAKTVSLPIHLSACCKPFKKGLWRRTPPWLQAISFAHKIHFEHRFQNVQEDEATHPYQIASQWSDSVPTSSFYSKYGLKQSAEFNTNCLLFDYLHLKPNFTYEIAYYGKKLQYVDYASEPIERPGHYMLHSYNLGATLTCSLQHTHHFQNIDQMVQAFRICTMPSFNFTYTPCIAQNHKHFQLVDGEKKYLFSRSIPSIALKKDRSIAALACILKNTVELKIRRKTDPNKTNQPKQNNTLVVPLLKHLDFSTKMDLNAQLHRLDEIRMHIASEALIWKIFQVKLDLDQTFDPYLSTYKEVGRPSYKKKIQKRSNILASTQGNYLGETKQSNFTISLELNPNNRSEKASQKATTLLSDGIANPDGQNLSIDRDQSWRMDCTLHWNYSQKTAYYVDHEQPYTKDRYVTLNGSLQILQNWLVNAGSAYDFINKTWKMSDTSLSIQRDLHCFVLNYKINPLIAEQAKQYKYEFSLAFKANALKALKLPRKRTFNTLQYRKLDP